MCKKCGKPLGQASITRSSTCEFCGADLHSCVNCTFYAPGSHYDCRETVDERVSDKNRANFCGYFSANNDVGRSGEKIAPAQKARDAFNALFGA